MSKHWHFAAGVFSGAAVTATLGVVEFWVSVVMVIALIVLPYMAAKHYGAIS